MRSLLNRILPLLFLASLCFGCFPSKKATVGAVGLLLEDIAKASYKQSDLRIIREAMPAYLLLMDGMVEAWPNNERLLLAAAQGYSSFASTVTDDQDKDFARLLYGKAREYALRSLDRRGFTNPLEKPFDEFNEGLKGFGKKDVPYLFWAAAAWGNWISLNLGSMEALAQLPRVESMMKRVLELDERFYYGGPHLFMGVWFASRPKAFGGDLKRSQYHFLRAIELGEGKFLMSYVYYAEFHTRQAMDKDLFVSVLQKVLEAPPDHPPELTLLNAVAKKRAKELLERVEELFD